MKCSSHRRGGFDKNATDLCKGIAVCLLVYFHLFGAYDESAYTAVIPVFRNIFAPYGNVCVVFFVLLTGYGFGVKYCRRREPYSRQILPRLLGLYQNYWFAFAVMLLVYPLLRLSTRPLSLIYGETFSVIAERFLLDFFGLSHFVFDFAPYSLNQTWWYMSLALLLILFLPLLCVLVRRAGWGTLAFALLLSLLLPDVRYLEYFPAAVLGVCLAKSDGFVRVRNKTATPLGVAAHFPALFAGLLVWYRMRQNGLHIVLADTLAAYLICQFAFDLLAPVPVLWEILQYLGKHSGNIFYTHSFLFVYWRLIPSFLYGFHYDLLIFAVTMGCSVLLSIGLEWLKKITGYNRLFARLRERLTAQLPTFAVEE